MTGPNMAKKLEAYTVMAHHQVLSCFFHFCVNNDCHKLKKATHNYCTNEAALILGYNYPRLVCWGRLFGDITAPKTSTG